MSANLRPGRCHRCGDERGRYIWGPMMHPGTFWCDRCLVETETRAARKAAEKLAALEARLAELGGPAERLLCGYVTYKVEGDNASFGSFCELEHGHDGYHEVAAVSVGDTGNTPP